MYMQVYISAYYPFVVKYYYMYFHAIGTVKQKIKMAKHLIMAV